MNRPLSIFFVLLLSVCAATAVAQGVKIAGPDREVTPEATGGVQAGAIEKASFFNYFAKIYGDRMFLGAQAEPQE